MGHRRPIESAKTVANAPRGKCDSANPGHRLNPSDGQLSPDLLTKVCRPSGRSLRLDFQSGPRSSSPGIKD
jgi:hypothetical protein